MSDSEIYKPNFGNNYSIGLPSVSVEAMSLLPKETVKIISSILDQNEKILLQNNQILELIIQTEKGKKERVEKLNFSKYQKGFIK